MAQLIKVDYPELDHPVRCIIDQSATDIRTVCGNPLQDIIGDYATLGKPFMDKWTNCTCENCLAIVKYFKELQ